MANHNHHQTQRTGYRFEVSGFLCVFLIASPQLLSAHEVYFQAGTSRWFYQEFSQDGSELDREQGYLPAFEIRADLNISARYSVLLEYGQQQGELSYIGYTQTGQPHTTKTDEARQRYRLGGQWSSEQGLQFSLAWQQHDWQRRIQPHNTVSGLNEYYRWSGPVAQLGYRWALSRGELALAAEAGYWQDSELIVDLRNSGFGRPALVLPAGYEYGLLLSYRFALNEISFIQLGHSQRYRYFPRSKATKQSNGLNIISLHEPETQSHEQEYWLGLGWRF